MAAGTLLGAVILVAFLGPLDDRIDGAQGDVQLVGNLFWPDLPLVQAHHLVTGALDQVAGHDDVEAGLVKVKKVKSILYNLLCHLFLHHLALPKKHV